MQAPCEHELAALRTWLLATPALVLAIVSACAAQGPPHAGAPPSGGRLEKLARRIEPNLHGRPERLPQYVDFFQKELANDARLFHFDVDAAVTAGGRVVLAGQVEFPEARAGIERFLGVLGFDDVDNQLTTVPAPELGDTAFALVKSPHALCYDSPRGPRGVVTDCLLGEPLYVLRAAGDHLLVHCGEGYLGYVAATDVVRVDGAEFDAYATAPAARMTTDHTAGDGLALPAGAVLKRAEPTGGGAGTGDGNTIACLLPSGETVDVPADACELADAPAEAIEQMVATAESFRGTRYVWGGKTTAGIDCSGLVQTAFAAAGIPMCRDANQQVFSGRLVATRWHRARLRRGDTLYFLGKHGRIRHTGLYLGDSQFLHATTPYVTVGSFDPQDANYDAARDKSFAFAKRLW